MGEESKSDKYKWVGTIATAVVSIVVAVTSMWETKINASSQEAASRESYVALSGAVESMSKQMQDQHDQIVSLKAYIDARRELRAAGPPPPPGEGAGPPPRAANPTTARPSRTARRTAPSEEEEADFVEEEDEGDDMPPPPPLPKPKGVKLPSYDAMLEQKAH